MERISVLGTIRQVGRWLRRAMLGDRSRRSLGDYGERLAERYLRGQGMKIVGRQVRIGGGEIDRIAIDGETVVFVEVKTRRDHHAGHPAEAVTEEKQRKLTRCALAYLRRHDLLEYAARFDVVAVIHSPDAPKSTRPRVEHVRSAFEPVGDWQLYA